MPTNINLKTIKKIDKYINTLDNSPFFLLIFRFFSYPITLLFLKLNISALGDGRKRLGEHATEMRETFGNSICAIRALKAGDIIKIEDLCLMKPRTGIAPHDLSKLLGATVISPIETRQPITWNCLKLKANE